MRSLIVATNLHDKINHYLVAVMSCILSVFAYVFFGFAYPDIETSKLT